MNWQLYDALGSKSKSSRCKLTASFPLLYAKTTPPLTLGGMHDSRCTS